MALKHIGRIATNKKKVIVAYRVIPGDPDHCLIVATESLDAGEHDALMSAVESAAGQQAYEFGEAMARTQLPDGRNMLAGFHTTGKFSRVRTDQIEMTPSINSSVLLSELNKIIAEQKGVTVADLALKGPDGTTKQPAQESLEKIDPVSAYVGETTTSPSTDGVLTDEQLAANLRSQADALFKEAKALREQAEELVPTKKKTVKTKESA